jgi:hypothetical protein
MSSAHTPFVGATAPVRAHSTRYQVAAVALAVVANAVSTTATDQLFHELSVFPPWGQPMRDPVDNLLALSYRTAFAVLCAYLAAALSVRLTKRYAAPGTAASPMRAAIAFGIVGFVLSALGAAVSITQYDLGPDWYPLLLVAVALPAAWVGGATYRRRAGFSVR